MTTLGDAAAIEAGMLKAIPDREKVKELRERRTYLENELSKVECSKNRLIQAVSDGLFSEEEIKSKIEEIPERENLFRSEIEGVTLQLNSGPTEEEGRRKARR